MQNQVQKFRYLFPEIYKDQKKLDRLKIGFVTGFIRNKFQNLSILYGLSFYAKVEQLFVYYQKEELQSISNYLKEVQNQQMLPEEKKQIETVQNWIQQIISFMEQNENLTIEKFIQFYNKAFYQEVFQEYAIRQNQYLVEECLSLTSSFYIQWWALKNQTNYPDIVNDCLKYLLSEQEDYQKLNDTEKISRLATVYNITIRFFLDCVDEIQQYEKVKSQIEEKRLNDLALNLIYDVEIDSFRIYYDQNYKFQYYKYQSNYQLYRSLNKEEQKCSETIQNVKQKEIDNKNNQLQKLSNEIYYLENEKEAEKNEFLNQINQYESMKIQQQELSSEIQNLLEKQEQLQNQQQAYQQQQQYDFAAQKQREQYELQQKQQNIEQQINYQLQQLKDQKIYQFVNSRQIDINISMKGNPQKLSTYLDLLPDDVQIKRKFYCQICCSSGENSIYFSCCQQTCCKECVIKYFENTEMILTKRKLVCPCCSKELENINQLITSNIITDKVMKIFKLQLNQCCKCRQHFYVKNKNAATVKCPACGAEHCMGCFQESHSKDSQLCQQQINNFKIAIDLHINQIQNQIEEKKAKENLNDEKVQKQIEELEKEKRFRICPICYNLLIKDDHCEHITCSECKTDLCFNCACLRIPTLWHDNQFHRRECRYCTERNEKFIEYKQQCPLCNKNQSVCKIPMDFQDYCKETVIEKFGLDFYNQYPPNWNAQ
ncbi:hypothetical protein ABPG74_019385 [Tetrahymena malaccensis]